MKIKSAKIELEDGRVFEVEDGTLLTLAHKMIEDSTPELPIRIPDGKMDEWKREAGLDHLRQPITWTARECHLDLYLRLKVEQFQAIERAKLAYNEMVLAYSERLKKAEQ